MERFDLRETVIPFSLLEMGCRLKRMAPGEECEILCCDKTVCEDIERILPRGEYECVAFETPNDDRGWFCIRLRKRL